MRVGVTGGAGFIGGWVTDILHQRGHTVVTFDPRGRAPDGAEARLGDVRDATAVTELAAHVDGIIHLAAVLGTQETIANPGPAAETNLLGSINVVNAARQYGLAVVQACVGNWWMNNSYSITKNAAERILAMYVTEHGLAGVNLRVVNAYGPRQSAAPPFAASKVRKIVPAFACRAIAGMPVEVYGDGEQVSDCVYVGDVATAFVRALEHAAAYGGLADTVEIGPTEHQTVNDIARLVVAAAGSDSEIVHLPMRPGEIPGATVTADPSTLKHIGWDDPELVPLADGVAETVEWFARNEGVTWERP